MALTVHPAERTDVLADALGELLATPLGDPFAEEVVVVPAKGVERWLTQRLSHRLGYVVLGRRRGLRRRAASSTRARWSRCCSTATATTRGTPTAWSGRCSRSSTPASTSRGAPRWPPTSATASTATTASCGATAATPSPAGSPASSRRTPSSGRRWSPTGARDATPTAPVARSTTTCAGRPSSGGGCSAGSTSRRPTSGTPTTLARLRAGGDGLDLPVAAVAVRPHPAPGHRGRAAGGARRAPRRAPLAAPALAAAVGRPGRHRRTGAARRRLLRRARRPSAARLARPRHPRAPADAGRGRSTRPQRAVRAVDDPDTLLGWLQADIRANHAPTVAERAEPPARRPTTAASRCTPATGPPARSTCCARCWSGCSRTTRRSSRATSS